jgi:hypothetical protein
MAPNIPEGSQIAMNVQKRSVIAWRAWDGDESLSAGCFSLPD